MTRGSWLTLTVAALSGLACATAPIRPAVITDAGVGIEMKLVKGGCFKMGSSHPIGGPEERPAHRVCVDDFYMAKTEVTQGQWAAVMGANPSFHANCGESCPVDMVSWNDAQIFIARLNQKIGGEGSAEGGYRLPTEAEWEYAARSGGKDELHSGRNDGDADQVGWFVLNSGDSLGRTFTHAVAGRAPNGLGLYDMTGNVWEWTNDWYEGAYYARSPRDNPAGPIAGGRRVLRGGGYANEATDARCTYRNYLPPEYRGRSEGFRLLRTPPSAAR
jgi:formylglycine-generating enzyme required for sulfatase activity